jgi:aspartate ammonia-lyase
MKNEIQVPRDNPKNKGVCRAVENLVLDLICKDITEAWHVKDMTAIANRRLGKRYGDDLANHVMHAVDQFFANKLVKRVAPSVFQAVDGPDEEFSERVVAVKVALRARGLTI